jgi:hypothetical protein
MDRRGRDLEINTFAGIFPISVSRRLRTLRTAYFLGFFIGFLRYIVKAVFRKIRR